MNDFDRRFKQQRDEFDRNLSCMRKFSFVAFIINVLISIGTIGFIVWVIVQLLQYYNIV